MPIVLIRVARAFYQLYTFGKMMIESNFLSILFTIAWISTVAIFNIIQIIVKTTMSLHNDVFGCFILANFITILG